MSSPRIPVEGYEASILEQAWTIREAMCTPFEAEPDEKSGFFVQDQGCANADLADFYVHEWHRGDMDTVLPLGEWIDELAEFSAATISISELALIKYAVVDIMLKQDEVLVNG